VEGGSKVAGIVEGTRGEECLFITSFFFPFVPVVFFDLPLVTGAVSIGVGREMDRERGGGGVVTIGAAVELARVGRVDGAAVVVVERERVLLAEGAGMMERRRGAKATTMKGERSKATIKQGMVRRGCYVLIDTNVVRSEMDE
jgi:hypothetical protein